MNVPKVITEKSNQKDIINAKNAIPIAKHVKIKGMMMT